VHTADNCAGMNGDPGQLSEALVVWTGKGATAWPSRDEARLVERFGESGALELLPVLRQLANDFYLSTAHNTAPDLTTMSNAAAADFRRMHPEIGDEGVEALAWCYTFDHK
jgi:hypothetical protein